MNDFITLIALLAAMGWAAGFLICLTISALAGICNVIAFMGGRKKC